MPRYMFHKGGRPEYIEAETLDQAVGVYEDLHGAPPEGYTPDEGAPAVEASGPAPATDDADDEDRMPIVAEANIRDIMAWVNVHPSERAPEVLEIEQGRGDDARPRLIGQLQALIEG